MSKSTKKPVAKPSKTDLPSVRIAPLSGFSQDSENANKGTEKGTDLLKKSLIQRKFARPTFAAKDLTILGGNKTLAAAAEVGMNEAIVIETDGSRPIIHVRTDLANSKSPEARRLAIEDNRIAEVSLSWDEGLLGAFAKFDGKVLEELWDEREIKEFLSENVNEPGKADAEVNIDKADELNKKWGVMLGDLWEVGRHYLLCGDSRNLDNIEKVMQGGRADIVITDPPYGVAIGAKNKMLRNFRRGGSSLAKIEHDDLKPEELFKVLLPVFKNIRHHVMSDECTVFVTAPQGGQLGMMMMMMKDAGLPVRHVLIWKKNHATFSMGRLDYDYQHEPILLTWGKRHKRPMLGKYRTSVWEVDKPRSSVEHPTMKPVEIYENALLNNSDRDDISFDAYCGSGTMLVASENVWRKARCIEIDPKFCAVALERMEQAFPGIEIKKIQSCPASQN